jgi:hypothetical protein
MQDLLNLIRWMLLGLFRSKTSLEAEILALRHQLNVLRRTSPRRPVFSNFDRMVFICLYRIAPRILDTLTIVEPETVSIGIAQASAPSGAGNRVDVPAGRALRRKSGG